MRSFFLTFLIVIVTRFCFGINLDTCPWPLKPGNVWYFEDRDHWHPAKMVSIQDSVIKDGKEYYTASLPLLPFTHFRIDSIGDVYTFCDGRDQLLFAFGTLDTTRKFVKYDTSQRWWVNLRYSQDSATVVFPGLSGKKVCALFDYDTVMIDDETEIWFVKSAGPSRVFRWMGPGTYCIEGCTINGVQYGTTATVPSDLSELYVHSIPQRNGINTFLSINTKRELFRADLIYTVQGKRISHPAKIPDGIFIRRQLSDY